MSTLRAAHDELTQRARDACRMEAADACFWESLAWVADYVRRLGDHGDTRHYRAEKAGALAEAALRLQREALIDYAGDGVEDEWLNLIEDLHLVVDKVVTQITAAMWAAARGHHIYTWQTSELRLAMADLRQRINRLCDNSVPDPDDEGSWS